MSRASNQYADAANPPSNVVAGRWPIVWLIDSGGARIDPGSSHPDMLSLFAGSGHLFREQVVMSGVVPQIAVVCGPCAGGAAYSPALMDFIIMTESHADLFITGPEVIKAVTKIGNVPASSVIFGIS